MRAAQAGATVGGGSSGGHGPDVEERPDGTRVYRLRGNAGLATLMDRLRAEQAARRR